MLALLAKALAVPPSSCSLTAGATSRWKRVMVEGPPEALEARLKALLAPP